MARRNRWVPGGLPGSDVRAKEIAQFRLTPFTRPLSPEEESCIFSLPQRGDIMFLFPTALLTCLFFLVLCAIIDLAINSFLYVVARFELFGGFVVFALGSPGYFLEGCGVSPFTAHRECST